MFMKGLLSPLKRIIFLSFILFTVFAGEDGCKCRNDSNSSSSSSGQGNGNSSGGQSSTSGSANQGGALEGLIEGCPVLLKMVIVLVSQAVLHHLFISSHLQLQQIRDQGIQALAIHLQLLT